MVRLLRALNSSVRVAAPSSRLIRRRWYSVAPDSLDSAAPTPNPPDIPNHEEKPVSRQPLKIKYIDSSQALRKKGVEAANTELHIHIPGFEKTILYTMLRDACRCPLCVDPYSKQRKIKTSQIKTRVRPRSIHLDGTTLEIKWTNDILGFDKSHVSTYNIADLVHSEPNPIRSNSGRHRNRLLWDRERMNTHTQHWITYNDYMHDEIKFARAMRHLALTGLIFLRDIPDSRDEVAKIATRMGPLRNTFYGDTWDVRSVPQAKNVAYTNQDLGFHSDLMYMQNPPGYQLLHCLENASVGGESMFLDAFRVAQDIFFFNRDTFDKLAALKVGYEYNHEDHVYSNKWPLFEIGKSKDPNTLVMEHVNYSPPFQSRMLNKTDSAHGAETVKLLRYFDNYLANKSRIFERKMQPGECAIFENRRVLHARRPFDLNSGNRWLAGAYVDEDALLSKFRTLRRKHPSLWHGYYFFSESGNEAGADNLDD